MEFSVIFHTNSPCIDCREWCNNDCSYYDYNVLSTDDLTIGLDFVDDARKKFGDVDIRTDINRFELKSYKLELSEQAARITGLFRNNNTVNVIVSQLFLNNFLIIEPELIDGVAAAVAKVDKEALFDAWKSDGCPQDWRRYGLS